MQTRGFITKQQVVDFLTAELKDQKTRQDRGSIRMDSVIGFNPKTQSLNVVERKTTGGNRQQAEGPDVSIIGSVSFRFRDGGVGGQAWNCLPILWPNIERINQGQRV